MMKSITAVLIIILLFLNAVSLTGCTGRGENINGLPGKLDKELGSISDYAGWWTFSEHVPGRSETPDFFYIEIPDDGGEIVCYDENGLSVAKGYSDYSEQRALNGNPLIFFDFELNGEYSAHPVSSEEGDHWLYLSGSADGFRFIYSEEQPFDPDAWENEVRVWREAVDAAEVMLMDRLGDKMDGKILKLNDDYETEGVRYFDFSLGRIGDGGGFIMEENYVINEEGEVYVFAGSELIRYDDNEPGSGIVPEYQTHEDYAVNLLTDLLGDRMEGKALVLTGEEDINGFTCKVFQFGVNNQDSFTAEEHYAVNTNGDVYTIDILQGADWVPFSY